MYCINGNINLISILNLITTSILNLIITSVLNLIITSNLNLVITKLLYLVTMHQHSVNQEIQINVIKLTKYIECILRN